MPWKSLKKKSRKTFEKLPPCQLRGNEIRRAGGKNENQEQKLTAIAQKKGIVSTLESLGKQESKSSGNAERERAELVLLDSSEKD